MSNINWKEINRKLKIILEQWQNHPLELRWTQIEYEIGMGRQRVNYWINKNYDENEELAPEIQEFCRIYYELRLIFKDFLLDKLIGASNSEYSKWIYIIKCNFPDDYNEYYQAKMDSVKQKSKSETEDNSNTIVINFADKEQEDKWLKLNAKIKK